jgi:hypothetical protein
LKKILLFLVLSACLVGQVLGKATVFDEWERATALDLNSGQKVVTVFGRFDAVPTSEVVIWDEGGQYVFLGEGVEAALSIVSSSAQDDSTPAGVGGHIMRIEGLNALKEEVVETVFLDGTTPVITATLFNRVNLILVITGGTDASNASNIGTITVTSTAAGTPLQGKILPGNSRAESCIYSTPANTRVLFITSSFGVEGNKQATISTKARIPSAFVNTFFVPILKHEFAPGVQEVNSSAAGPSGSIDVIATAQASSGTVMVSCLLQFFMLNVDTIN